MDCVGRPCGPFQLVDLQLSAIADGDDRGALRLQLGERAIVGFAWTDGARTWRLRGSRLQASVRDEEGRLDLAAGWRGHRFDVRVDAHEADPVTGAGWRVGIGVGYRPSVHLRLGIEALRDLDDTAPSTLAPRPLTRVGAEALWQPGPRLELRGGFGWARVRDGLDARSGRWSVDAGLRWQLPRLLVTLDSHYDETRGRFRRREAGASFGADVAVTSNLLASGAVHESVELGVAERARSWSAGLTLHGREYRYPRGGRVGVAVEELARLAWEAGYGMTRVYELEGLRELRERMRLTGRPALRAAAEAVYEAEVADRHVPSLQVRWERGRREDVALRLDRVAALVAVPWRPAWPWRMGEHRTELLRLEIAYTEARFAGETLEIGRRVVLEAPLNRELLVRVGWERRIRSPLELALGKKPPGGLLATLRYAYGR